MGSTRRRERKERAGKERCRKEETRIITKLKNHKAESSPSVGGHTSALRQSAQKAQALSDASISIYLCLSRAVARVVSCALRCYWHMKQILVKEVPTIVYEKRIHFFVVMRAVRAHDHPLYLPCYCLNMSGKISSSASCTSKSMRSIFSGGCAQTVILCTVAESQSFETFTGTPRSFSLTLLNLSIAGHDLWDASTRSISTCTETTRRQGNHTMRGAEKEAYPCTAE